MNLREAGQGRLIVFLHGITANGAVWDPVLHSLKDSFRVVGVDQRGHGLSDKPEAGYGEDEFADDVLRLIEVLDGAPAIIVGHSLGARNGIVAAEKRPDLVAGVVAIEWTPFIDNDALVSLETRVNSGYRTFASKDEIIEYLAGRYPLMPRDALERRARHGYVPEGGSFRPQAAPVAMAATAGGLFKDIEPATAAVRRPILLVRGAVSKLLSTEAFDRTRAMRPDFGAMTVPNTDHYVPEEAPDTVANAIRSFVHDLKD